MELIQYRCSHLELGRTRNSFALELIHLDLDDTWNSGAWISVHLELGRLDLILLGSPALGTDSQDRHKDIIRAMNIRRVWMICKVSYVTITVLSFAFNMSLIMLYTESILLTLFPCNATHYDDIKGVHYH